jgi:hypothetical protein
MVKKGLLFSSPKLDLLAASVSTNLDRKINDTTDRINEVFAVACGYK